LATRRVPPIVQSVNTIGSRGVIQSAMARKVSQDAVINALTERLLRVLHAQRGLGPDSYPLTVGRLIELTDPEVPAALVNKALGKKVFRQATVRTRAAGPEAPLALADDLDLLAASPLTLEFLLRHAATPATRAFTPAGLHKHAAAKLKKPIKDALERHSAAGTLPPTVGWILIGGRKHFFLLADLHTAGQNKLAPADSRGTQPPAPSPADFGSVFDAVFGQLDRQAGSHNFVRLVELRQALPVPREAFDAGLQQLRRQGHYVLSAAEGRQGITPEERAAGIAEEGSLLLFVSRSTP
jgi:hypothetical protein